MAILGLAAVLAAGCASHSPQVKPTATPGPLAGHPRVAVLPVENLTPIADAGDRVTRILFAALARTGSCDVVESGDVERALFDLRVRDTGSIPTPLVRALGDTLHAGYVLSSSLLEFGTTRTPDADVPSVGLALKLVETATGKVAWAALKVRTGDDRETVFGWGRVRQPARLAEILADEAFLELRNPSAPRPGTTATGRDTLASPSSKADTTAAREGGVK